MVVHPSSRLRPGSRFERLQSTKFNKFMQGKQTSQRVHQSGKTSEQKQSSVHLTDSKDLDSSSSLEDEVGQKPITISQRREYFAGLKKNRLKAATSETTEKDSHSGVESKQRSEIIKSIRTSSMASDVFMQKRSTERKKTSTKGILSEAMIYRRDRILAKRMSKATINLAKNEEKTVHTSDYYDCQDYDVRDDSKNQARASARMDRDSANSEEGREDHFLKSDERAGNSGREKLSAEAPAFKPTSASIRQKLRRSESSISARLNRMKFPNILYNNHVSFSPKSSVSLQSTTTASRPRTSEQSVGAEKLLSVSIPKENDESETASLTSVSMANTPLVDTKRMVKPPAPSPKDEVPLMNTSSRRRDMAKEIIAKRRSKSTLYNASQSSREKMAGHKKSQVQKQNPAKATPDDSTTEGAMNGQLSDMKAFLLYNQPMTLNQQGVVLQQTPISQTLSFANGVVDLSPKNITEYNAPITTNSKNHLEERDNTGESSGAKTQLAVLGNPNQQVPNASLATSSNGPMLNISPQMETMNPNFAPLTYTQTFDAQQYGALNLHPYQSGVVQNVEHIFRPDYHQIDNSYGTKSQIPMNPTYYEIAPVGAGTIQSPNAYDSTMFVLSNRALSETRPPRRHSSKASFDGEAFQSSGTRTDCSDYTSRSGSASTSSGSESCYTHSRSSASSSY